MITLKSYQVCLLIFTIIFVFRHGNISQYSKFVDTVKKTVSIVVKLNVKPENIKSGVISRKL